MSLDVGSDHLALERGDAPEVRDALRNRRIGQIAAFDRWSGAVTTNSSRLNMIAGHGDRDVRLLGLHANRSLPVAYQADEQHRVLME